MATDQVHAGIRWRGITPGPNAIEPVPASIFAGVGGTITAEGDDGVSATFSVADGDILPIQPVRITAATAAGLVAIYN